MAKGKLRLAIEDFLDTFGFGDKIRSWFIGVLEGIEFAIVGDTRYARDELLKQALNTPELRAMFADLLSGTKQGGMASVAGFGVSLGMGAASGLVAPLSRMLNYVIDKKVLSARVDPTVANAMYWRSGKLFTGARDQLKDLGWSQELQTHWTNVIRPHLGVVDALTLGFRGAMSKADVRRELLSMGWATIDIPRIEELGKLLPSVQDMVTMAVREAFDPGAISSLGLDQELPGIFVQEATKLGLSEDWAKRYWYAHWRLPSIGQGFEMLHRLRPGVSNNPFDLNDMRQLLKVLDISPRWREQLIEISFNPITRVDNRRLYDEGVINRDKVKSNYLDIGYNEENAELLTQWTVNRRQSTNKGLTRGVITKAQKLGTLTSGGALEALEAIGFDSQEAQFFVSLTEFEIDQDKTEEILDGIEFLFVEGIIDTVEVYSRTGKLGLPATQIESKLEVWEIRRAKKTRLPSRAELDKFYLAEIISDVEYRNQLSKKRYPINIIDWFVIQLDNTSAELAKVESDRVRREEEKVLARTEKSLYSISKAALDVDIAEIRVIVAEIKLLAHELDDPDQLDVLAKRLVEAKVIIADLNLQKSKLRHSLELTLEV